jgi:hypothetical protein
LVSTFYYKDMKGLWCWTGFLKRPSAGQSSLPMAVEEKTETAAVQLAKELPPEAPTDGFDLDGDEFKVRAE